jgi:hypothetical protein
MKNISEINIIQLSEFPLLSLNYVSSNVLRPHFHCVWEYYISTTLESTIYLIKEPTSEANGRIAS